MIEFDFYGLLEIQVSAPADLACYFKADQQVSCEKDARSFLKFEIPHLSKSTWKYLSYQRTF